MKTAKEILNEYDATTVGENKWNKDNIEQIMLEFARQQIILGQIEVLEKVEPSERDAEYSDILSEVKLHIQSKIQELKTKLK